MTCEVTADARDDAWQVALYYDRVRYGLGDDLLDTLYDAYAIIQRQPQSFSPVHPAVSGREVRFYGMHRFPYQIAYEVIPARIMVLAVVHNQRRTGLWRRRLTP
jgi:plasmid stabilization system protein ParE